MAPSAAEQVEKDSGDEEETEITCLSCGHHISATPILKRRIVGYFAGILEVQKSRPEVGKRNNLRIRVEGEAITSDEFQTLLEEEIASKEAKKKSRKGKKQTQKSQLVSYTIAHIATSTDFKYL